MLLGSVNSELIRWREDGHSLVDSLELLEISEITTKLLRF